VITLSHACRTPLRRPRPANQRPVPAILPPPIQWLTPCAIMVTPMTRRSSASARSMASIVCPSRRPRHGAAVELCRRTGEFADRVGDHAFLDERQQLQMVGGRRVADADVVSGIGLEVE